MRLTPTQIDTINSTAQAMLGKGARVTLFGTRVDDQARGWDVDLMIEVPQALAEPDGGAARGAAVKVSEDQLARLQLSSARLFDEDRA